MIHSKPLRFFPLAALILWQMASGLGLGQVREGRAWIEGMT